MRGKEMDGKTFMNFEGITPAHAGKRRKVATDTA